MKSQVPSQTAQKELNELDWVVPGIYDLPPCVAQGKQRNCPLPSACALTFLGTFDKVKVRLRFGGSQGGVAQSKVDKSTLIYFIKSFFKAGNIVRDSWFADLWEAEWVTSCLKFIIYKLLLYLISHITFFYCIFTLKTKNKLWLSYIISIYKLEKAPW